MYCRNVKLLRKQSAERFCSQVAFYSRRNNSKYEDYYKAVGKTNGASKEKRNTVLAPIPNWELMTPSGYRFYMPDNIGPAWHDRYTTSHLVPKDFCLEDSKLVCSAQECPILLREGISRLFHGIDLSYSQLTIISLMQKRIKYGMSGSDLESITKTFVVTGQEICHKLKESGYWADFINPFSGLPAMNSYPNKVSKTPLTTTTIDIDDAKFKYTGFRIVEKQHCLLIENKKTQRFIGNIFTNAPHGVEKLRMALLQDDDFYEH